MLFKSTENQFYAFKPALSDILVPYNVHKYAAIEWNTETWYQIQQNAIYLLAQNTFSMYGYET